MTTAEAVRAATARGLRFGIEEGVVYVYGDGSVIDEMAPMLTPHKGNIAAAIREHAEAMTVTNAALAAARLLRLGTWPPTNAANCAFHCGKPGESCGRCGASWTEHNAKNRRAKPKTQPAQ